MKYIIIIIFLLATALPVPAETVTLPPPPGRLIKPDSGESILKPISETEFVWSIVAKAVKYHLEVSSDHKFYRIIREAFPEENRYLFETMPEGTYFWRVSSIDDRGMEGRPGPIHYFVYSRGRRSRSLKAGEKPGNRSE
ncbi:MAG: hypothetical protein U9N73_07845 [Candidatus Auribacterota bacterium]|nr:hypothetical protein [Candidatus Auribacterota bacterium]